MRLSGPTIDRSHAIAVIHEALEGGVNLLDTADVYAPSAGQIGHNERLVARALATWDGPTDGVTVVTKGGLVRGDRRWRPDGRAKHLRAACEASLVALDVDRISLYLLHALDPRTPLSTSSRALASLCVEGLVEAVGVSNLTVEQIRTVADYVPVAAVQVALSPEKDDPIRNGILQWCEENDALLLAHTPLGGPKKAGRWSAWPGIAKVAERHQATPAQIVLAWLRDLSPAIVPIPGPTRSATAADAGHAARLSLTPDDRSLLATPKGGLIVRGSLPTRPSPGSGREVVIVMGVQGSGKSTIAREMEETGYLRLNRDDRGGRVRDLLPTLAEELAAGVRRVVMDNTYPSRAERHRVIEVAWRAGVPVRCIWAKTPPEQAQVNAALRMVERYGRVLDRAEIKVRARADPGAFLPSTIGQFLRVVEGPSLAEGFEAVDVRPFERTWPEDLRGPALVVELDGVVRTSARGGRIPLAPADIVVQKDVVAGLRAARDAGFALFGIAWIPEVASGHTTIQEVQATLDRTRAMVGLPIESVVCPHPGGPPSCWCRKPLPGLIVELVLKHRFDPRASVLVGPGPADRRLADTFGMRFLQPAALAQGDLDMRPPRG